MNSINMKVQRENRHEITARESNRILSKLESGRELKVFWCSSKCLADGEVDGNDHDNENGSDNDHDNGNDKTTTMTMMTRSTIAQSTQYD